MKDLCIFKKVIVPKMSGIWLKFVFQLPKDLVLELFGKHYSCSEQISWDDMSIWLRIHFSGQRLMHRLWSALIFLKMLRLKCQSENLTEMYIIFLFTHLYFLLNENQWSFLTLDIRLYRHCISITKNVNLAVILQSEGGVTPNDF